MVRIIVGTCALIAALAPLALAEAAEAAPPVQLGVDPRVELMSIIFRLAGNPEYGKGRIASYNRDVEAHFGPHSDHAVVKMARELRGTRGVSYDAPMSLAVHLSEGYELREKVPFEPRPPKLDGRWRLDEARRFLEDARDFVQESGFQEFFESHQPLYDQATARMEEVVEKHAHLEWFGEYFGTIPEADFHLIIGMLNGPNCYGPSLAGGRQQELYCILGTSNADRHGIPRFSRSNVPTIAHEFCHSYVNPHVYKHTEELKEAGQRMYAPAAARMKKMAYGNWQTMMHESMVRACVVRYLAAHQGAWAANLTALAEYNRGFSAVPGLAKLLDQYEADREKYPTFESFFPRIIEFVNEHAESLPAGTRPVGQDGGEQVAGTLYNGRTGHGI